ncbi:polyprenol monophosphomannose synthase [Microbacterium sp. XT11]|uniref:polyprenol monophosphomannose synthase n=1 Tax=Microbacterium sp. XT11 TaxID=367477 RepID=UPI00082E27C0|nr:polyprenol monophosphomannose synthase [Microbacterium sp. XT11]
MSAPTVVVLPTYNELESLPEMVARITRSAQGVDILVVDDASPDGTGELADLLSARMAHVHVLHRPGKQGLGRAYVAGFTHALELGYEIVVQCDADGSHRPEDLPRMLQMLADADVVIGSRWVSGGVVSGWTRGRLLLSRAGSWYAGRALRLPQTDITGGYRVFRANALRRIELDLVHSHGYCFQIEMLDRAARSGARIVEAPITFDDRLHGESKMSARIVVEALRQVTRWGIERRLQAGDDSRRHAEEVVGV